MERGFGRTVLYLAGLVLLVIVAWWLLKALLKLAFVLILGTALAGGGYYLYTRARRALREGRLTRYRNIGR